MDIYDVLFFLFCHNNLDYRFLANFTLMVNYIVIVKGLD